MAKTYAKRLSPSSFYTIGKLYEVFGDDGEVFQVESDGPQPTRWDERWDWAGVWEKVVQGDIKDFDVPNAIIPVTDEEGVRSYVPLREKKLHRKVMIRTVGNGFILDTDDHSQYGAEAQVHDVLVFSTAEALGDWIGKNLKHGGE